MKQGRLSIPADILNPYTSFITMKLNVTGSDRFDFSPRSQSYINKFHYQNQLDLSGLPLLTTFPNHSGKLYKHSGT